MKNKNQVENNVEHSSDKPDSVTVKFDRWLQRICGIVQQRGNQLSKRTKLIGLLCSGVLMAGLSIERVASSFENKMPADILLPNPIQFPKGVSPSKGEPIMTPEDYRLLVSFKNK